MSYSRVDDHHSMALDDTRNSFYQEAITKIVNKDSVVMDLGAGLGIHGLMALLSGARKAYFVEPAEIINTTERVIAANNMSQQAVCLQSKIEDVQLTEKVDVIMSVFTGNFLLSEDLLPSLFFARDKFLKAGGRLIPERGVMEVVPVTMPEYYAKYIDCWSQLSQGVNFESIRNFAINSLYYDTGENHKSSFLAKPAELLDLDFMTATEAACKNDINVEISQDGLCHGWLGWFKIAFDEQWLSTSPKAKKTHWSQVFLPLAEPVAVKKGDSVSFKLDRPEFGAWTWTTGTVGKNQRCSTFYSEIISPQKIQQLKENDN